MENLSGVNPKLTASIAQSSGAAGAAKVEIQAPKIDIGEALRGKPAAEKETKSGKDFNKEMKADFKAAEERLKESGLKGKELKKALKTEKENIRAQYCEKGFISYDNSQAWLNKKMESLKAENPDMSKKELKNAAKDAFKEQFGMDAPKKGFLRTFGSVLLGPYLMFADFVLGRGDSSFVGDKIADARDNSSHKQYEVRT